MSSNLDHGSSTIRCVQTIVWAVTRSGMSLESGLKMPRLNPLAQHQHKPQLGQVGPAQE